MNKTLRLILLLTVLAAVAGFYFFLTFGFPPSNAMPERKPPSQVTSTTQTTQSISVEKQALRRGDFVTLNNRLDSLEAQAPTDYQAELAFSMMIFDLGHADEQDLKLLERWAESGSHYGQLALANAYQVRAFLYRGSNYIDKVDAFRLQRFRALAQDSIEQASRAVAQHPGCGLAYAMYIETVSVLADRAQVDKVYLRAQQAAPQWVYPLLAYQHALHPNWHGRPNERTQFITNLEKEHPEHRALPYLWAAEYALAASDALADQNYGQGMVQADFALERNSKNASAWESKGRAFLGVQRSPEGLRALSRAIELNPFSDSAYTARGIARFNAGETGGQEDYVQAALLGDSWALKTVFWNLLSGKTPGVPQDQAQLPILCNRLQTVGVPDSIFCMATVYYFGYGVPQDVKKGFELMRLAADQGEADAMSDVGKIYWQGNPAAGVARDKEQALRYWLRAASIGSDRALVELSQVKNDSELPQLINKIRNEQREANAIAPK